MEHVAETWRNHLAFVRPHFPKRSKRSAIISSRWCVKTIMIAENSAIVTYLQAKAYNKPLVLLPFVVTGGFHHGSVIYNAEKGEMRPADLPGKSFGVRSYAQTTGVWVRGVLQNEYGADLDKVTFVTIADGHLAEYTDPPNCVRAPKGKKLMEMLFNGEVDTAAMLPSSMPKDPRLRTLIKDPDAAAQAWSKKMGIVPINHMYVVRKDSSRQTALTWCAKSIARWSKRGIRALKPAAGEPTFGLTLIRVEADPQGLEIVIDYSYQQKIIPRKFTVDRELFDDTTRVLGK